MADKNLELITGILMHTSSFYFYYFPSHFTRSLSISALFLFYLTYFSGFLLPFPFISLPLGPIDLHTQQSSLLLAAPLSTLIWRGKRNNSKSTKCDDFCTFLFSISLSPALNTHSPTRTLFAQVYLPLHTRDTTTTTILLLLLLLVVFHMI